MVLILQDMIIDFQDLKVDDDIEKILLYERTKQDILISPIMLLIVVEILIRQIYLSLIIIGQYYQ